MIPKAMPEVRFAEDLAGVVHAVIPEPDKVQCRHFDLPCVVRPAGVKPAASAVSGRRLPTELRTLVRGTGLEPARPLAIRI